MSEVQGRDSLKQLKNSDEQELDDTKKLIKSLGFDNHEVRAEDLQKIREYVIGLIEKEDESGEDALFKMNMAGGTK